MTPEERKRMDVIEKMSVLLPDNSSALKDTVWLIALAERQDAEIKQLRQLLRTAKGAIEWLSSTGWPGGPREKILDAIDIALSGGD